MSHRRIVGSRDPDASVFPSGLKLRQKTASGCPTSGGAAAYVAVSQRWIFLSRDPAASHAPSGLYATLSTAPSASFKTLSGLPVRSLQTRTERSCDPDA